MYTYSDGEVDTTRPYKLYIIIGLVAAFVIFLLALIGIGLSRGPRLEFTEFVFSTSSTQDNPRATCLEYHKSVVSTQSIYDAFVDACDWTEEPLFSTGFFSTDVYVLYFVNDAVLNQPRIFHDYPFLIDGYEVIRVRDRRWSDPQDEWYIYFIQMAKDDIDSANILFD